MFLINIRSYYERILRHIQDVRLLMGQLCSYDLSLQGVLGYQQRPLFSRCFILVSFDAAAFECWCDSQYIFKCQSDGASEICESEFSKRRQKKALIDEYSTLYSPSTSMYFWNKHCIQKWAVFTHFNIYPFLGVLWKNEHTSRFPTSRFQ